MGPLLLFLLLTYELKGILEPAARASITLQSNSTPFTTSTLTAADGRFRFSKLDAGIYTNLMVPPSTPAGLNIVRISLSAAHSEADISRMIEALGQLASQKPAAA